MKKASVTRSSDMPARRRPAISEEADEQRMISLATNLARKQLEEGTASSQVITHYLKLGTSVAKLERSKLEKENKLLDAKTESIQSEQRSEELFKQAIEAMKHYSGRGDSNDY